MLLNNISSWRVVFQTIFDEIISEQINDKIAVLRIYVPKKENMLQRSMPFAYFLLKIRHLFRIESCILRFLYHSH